MNILQKLNRSYIQLLRSFYLCLHQTHILQWSSYHASQGEYMPLVILPKQQTHYWWGHQTKSRCTCNVSRELECSLSITTKDDAKFEGVSNTSCLGPSAWYTVLPLWRLLWESELLIGWSSPAKKGGKANMLMPNLDMLRPSQVMYTHFFHPKLKHSD